MASHTKKLGQVDNSMGLNKEVSVPTAMLVLGSSAVGAFIGFKIGGGVGTAVGALVGAFVGALAAGLIKNFKVKLHKSGCVEVSYDTRFA